MELKTKKLAAASGNHFFVIMKEDHLKGGVALFVRFKMGLIVACTEDMTGVYASQQQVKLKYLN